MPQRYFHCMKKQNPRRRQVYLSKFSCDFQSGNEGIAWIGCGIDLEWNGERASYLWTKCPHVHSYILCQLDEEALLNQFIA